MYTMYPMDMQPTKWYINFSFNNFTWFLTCIIVYWIFTNTFILLPNWVSSLLRCKLLEFLRPLFKVIQAFLFGVYIIALHSYKSLVLYTLLLSLMILLIMLFQHKGNKQIDNSSIDDWYQWEKNLRQYIASCMLRTTNIQNYS